MTAVQEAAQLIKQLHNSGRIGRIRDLGGTLEVEILHPGWKGTQRSYRLFPDVFIDQKGDEVILTAGEAYRRAGEAALVEDYQI